MIAWSPIYPPSRKCVGYLRLLKAQALFHEHFGVVRSGRFRVRLGKKPGDHEKLESLRNIHEGRRAFILGTGPSLTIEDVRRLKDEITFGCNGLYKMYSTLGWAANYHTVIDRTQLEDRAADLNRLKGPRLLVPLFAAYCIRRRPNVTYLPFRWPNKNGYSFPLFSTDAAACVWDGMTVTATNLQLAYHMGIREAILLGVDFSYDLTSSLTSGSDTMAGIAKSPDHFIPDYYTGKKRFVQFYPELQRQAYRLATKVYREAGGKVVNASRMTKLDVVERVDFESLFVK
jgi:hypothetical protein